MAAKPVQFRDRATFDLESASGYYVAEADVATAIRFVDAVEAASRRIGRNPRLGSLRFAYELTVPDLRVVAVGRFPYLLFYLERETSVDVWRLLHASRDGVGSAPNLPKARPPGNGASNPQSVRVVARSSRAGSGASSLCG